MPESEAGFAAELDLYVEELARLERRLRGLSVAAWRSRTGPVKTMLADLVALAAEGSGDVPRELPEIAEYALADALVVIGGDVHDSLMANPDRARSAVALSTVRLALDATR